MYIVGVVRYLYLYMYQTCIMRHYHDMYGYTGDSGYIISVLLSLTKRIYRYTVYIVGLNPYFSDFGLAIPNEKTYTYIHYIL